MKSKILLEITVRGGGFGIREARSSRSGRKPRLSQATPSKRVFSQDNSMTDTKGRNLAKHEGNVRYKTINMGKRLTCKCHFCSYIFNKK